MVPAFKDHFSTVAEAYRSFRPAYPEELFQWLAEVAPGQQNALDCGCGTGQATRALARYFSQVYGVDPSAEQIERSCPEAKVTYRVAPAEATGLPDRSQDLIIAAQALHWFDLDHFYPEVRRLARPGAVFAALSYGLLTISAELDSVIRKLYQDLLGPYWPPERRHVEAGYRTLPFPFRELTAPSLAMSARWTADQVLGYLSTWSAVKEYKTKTGRDPLTETGKQLHELWGETEKPRPIFWPLVVRAGYVD